jgi:hypothetical protein
MLTISYITIVITCIVIFCVCILCFNANLEQCQPDFPFLYLNAYFLHNKISVIHGSIVLQKKILSTNKTFTCHIIATHAKICCSDCYLKFGLFLNSSLCPKRCFLWCIVKMSQLK